MRALDFYLSIYFFRVTGRSVLEWRKVYLDEKWEENAIEN